MRVSREEEQQYQTGGDLRRLEQARVPVLCDENAACDVGHVAIGHLENKLLLVSHHRLKQSCRKEKHDKSEQRTDR